MSFGSKNNVDMGDHEAQGKNFGATSMAWSGAVTHTNFVKECSQLALLDFLSTKRCSALLCASVTCRVCFACTWVFRRKPCLQIHLEYNILLPMSVDAPLEKACSCISGCLVGNQSSHWL